MNFAVTIDVEEDNWSNYDKKPELSNIERIEELQKLFDKYEVKPTYLVTYPVASDKKSITLLRTIMEYGRCEIGAHVHPWNTPPFEEEKNVKNTMLFNLEKELQYKKIESLHEKIYESFKIEPITFRSGRWGFDKNVAENICKLGYKVDTSVSPYINWEKDYGPDYSNYSPKPHYIPINDNEKSGSCLLEIPATIGFLQSNYDACNRVIMKISSSSLKKFRLVGILDKLNIINKVWLSPEVSGGKEMIKLSNSIRKKGYEIINMFFHSSSLKAGLTPFTKSIEDEQRIMNRIEEFLIIIRKENVRPITLRETCQIFTM